MSPQHYHSHRGQGYIPVSESNITSIPRIAYTIPDFEGQAILRVFSNSTKSQIACFSASLTNGASFAHPAAVGSILGILTAIAIVTSFATVIYGAELSSVRNHYAHVIIVIQGLLTVILLIAILAGAISTYISIT